MKHAERLALIVCAIAFLAIVGDGYGQTRRPNIVIIVADDMGYADIGVHGSKDIPTPNIDALAKSGIRFTDAYVSGPYCSPTRAGLLTARYPQRFGHEFNPAPDDRESGLPLSEKTLADHLQSAGYRTALFGKWHLGYLAQQHPMARGFDEFFGFLGGAHSYHEVAPAGQTPIYDGRAAASATQYFTDEIADRAAAFINRNQSQPFLLYLAFNAVHTPMHATDQYLARFASISDERRRTYAAMLSAMDDGIGKTLAALREQKLEENTLIFFFSDNGGPTMERTSVNGSSNAPLRGSKRQTWEGGIRVPFIISWKGRLAAGKVDARPIIQLDVMPTALAAAEVKVQKEWRLDGVDLLPYLTGKTTGTPHDTLYWRLGEHMAIRQGDWKLVKSSEGALRNRDTWTEADVATGELYNLATDISESRNLASDEPAKVKELSDAWLRWNAQLIKPLWHVPLDAQEAHVHEKGAHAHDRLGTVVFPNSGARAAQPAFLRGVALLHSFEYELARESFAEARAADRSFALAYWMDALANRATLWGIERLDSARAVLAQLGATPTQRLAQAKTERERAYGAAVEALFADVPETQRVRAFADSMRKVIAKYPDDLEAHAFTAIGLLGVTMTLPDSMAAPVIAEAIEHAQYVRRRNADHPGALHYLIHSYDHPERAAQGLEVARAYARTAPSSEHALHMPSHIFVQVGLWDDVVASNEAAWAASRAEVIRRKVSPSENDFHSLAWLQYAYLQQGRNADARALIDTARAVLKGIDLTGADYIDPRYAVSDLEFAYANETGDWSAAPAGMGAPGTVGPSMRAQNFAARDRYARAFSAAMRGDTATANALLPQLRGRASLLVRALLAQRRGNDKEAITLLQEAVALEEPQTPYGPSYGPPSLELLGAALLKAGRAGEAKGAYERSLQRRPNRKLALEGVNCTLNSASCQVSRY